MNESPFWELRNLSRPQQPPQFLGGITQMTYTGVGGVGYEGRGIKRGRVTWFSRWKKVVPKLRLTRETNPKERVKKRERDREGGVEAIEWGRTGSPEVRLQWGNRLLQEGKEGLDLLHRIGDTVELSVRSTETR